MTKQRVIPHSNDIGVRGLSSFIKSRYRVSKLPEICKISICLNEGFIIL